MVGPPVTNEDLVSSANRPPRNRRSIMGWVFLVVLVITAVVGSNLFSLRDRLFGSAVATPELPATSRIASGSSLSTPVIGSAGASEPTSLRSYPWWQSLATLDGAGDSTTSAFTIADSALQWRVNWSCDSGFLMVRDLKRNKSIVNGGCPQGSPGYGDQTGATTLQVIASGPWHLEIEQQIDAPLVEPPTAGMTTPGSSVAALGSFYGIDQTGIGEATLYHQADGTYSLRLANFFVTATTDLELRMSGLAAPHNSQDVASAPSILVSALDVTAGSLNYEVSGNIDVSKFQSVYIWCAATHSAYAGASLMAAP